MEDEEEDGGNSIIKTCSWLLCGNPNPFRLKRL